jgi:predicted phage tail protein
MLRKIKLYGQLAEFVGYKEFEVKVNNLSQAVSFLVNNFPEIEAHMNPKYYQVKVGDYDIGEDEISYPIGKQDIHFIPVISGAGRGIGKILLGAALIGISFGFPFTLGAGPSLSLEAGISTGFGIAKAGALSKAAFYIGGALVLQGVSELLFPLPKLENSEEDPQLSFNFSGIQNTSRAGTPVPIVYGEIFTGSVVISAAIDTNQVEA